VTEAQGRRPDRGTELQIHFPDPTPDSPSELRLSWADLELVGTSVATLATAFAVATFRVAIDMGRCSAVLAAQETVLLTHCHSDHVAGLVAWLSAHTRRYQGAPTRIMVPAARRDGLLAALEIWPELDGVRRRVRLDDVLVPALPGERFKLANGGWAHAFAVHHSVPSVGWAIGRTGRDRADLVFAGDGTPRPFEEKPQLLDAGVALVDCSFVDDGTRVAARLGGHGHLQDWLALLASLPCDTLVLAHLPADASADEVALRIRSAGAIGPTVVPWMGPPRRS
jgi:ribonuclease BN (tRNA processing enzyme)